MKKRYSLLLAGCLMLSVSVIAKAQPPESAAPVFHYPLHIPRTPEDTIEGFISRESTFQDNNFDDYVEGLDPNNSSSPEVEQLIRQVIGRFMLTAKNISVSPNPSNVNLVTANFTLEFSDDALGIRLEQKDSVELKRHLIPDNKYGGGNEYWSIVPGNPQKYFVPFNINSSSSEKSGFVGRLATLVAYPDTMLPKIYLQQSELQLRQLGLALLQRIQDYDLRVDIYQGNYVEKLTPYVKNISVFTEQNDAPGTISYSINPNISGVNVADFTSPSETVAFYLGHDQNLDFRYGGLSPVCFMDGHVKAISPEQAKGLRWMP